MPADLDMDKIRESICLLLSEEESKNESVNTVINQDDYRFCWESMTQEDYVYYSAKLTNEILFSGDMIGMVRVGDICIDLSIYSPFQEGPIRCEDEAYLCLEFFVGGVDTGYAYSGSGYPYDHVEEASYKAEDAMIDLDYTDFQKKLEAVIKQQLNSVPYDKANLTEKALGDIQYW